MKQKTKKALKEGMNQTIREFIPYEIALSLENKGKIAPVSYDETLWKHTRGFFEGLVLVVLAGGVLPADLLTGFEILHGVPTIATILGFYSMFDHLDRLENCYKKAGHATYLVEKGYKAYKGLRNKITKK